MRPVQVLLVDDERDFLDPLALRLGRRNFSVSTAESGDEALAKTANADFDVVVLPELDVDPVGPPAEEDG